MREKKKDQKHFMHIPMRYIKLRKVKHLRNKEKNIKNIHMVKCNLHYPPTSSYTEFTKFSPKFRVNVASYQSIKTRKTKQWKCQFHCMNLVPTNSKQYPFKSQSQVLLTWTKFRGYKYTTKRLKTRNKIAKLHNLIFKIHQFYGVPDINRLVPIKLNILVSYPSDVWVNTHPHQVIIQINYVDLSS